MQKYLAILIVIVCTILLQAHSIPFWLEQSNSYIGYLWSFTIEGVALWLWLNKKMILAIIASAIIILVPLMQLSNPLLKEMRLLNANVEIKKLNSLSISQSEKLQDKYITTNWAGTINKNITHLRSDIDNQKELLSDTSKLKSVYENIFIIVLQSVALMVVLLTQIQAIRMLAFPTVSSLKHEVKHVEHMTPLELLTSIEAYVEDEVISYSTLAFESGISKSFFTRLKARVNGDESAVTNVLLKSAEEKFLALKNKKEIESE